MKPKIYITTWTHRARPGHRGSGKTFRIQIGGRSFEQGDGMVPALVPDEHYWVMMRSGSVPVEHARRAYLLHRQQAFPDHEGLSPRSLWAAEVREDSTTLWDPVQDGDTLCCNCKSGEVCHRDLAAQLLHDAGWVVILDGEEFTGAA